MSNSLTFIDLFSGIGGFRKGLENAGHKCIGFCEFDKFAAMSYISMHLITDKQRQYLATLDFKTRQKEILKEEYRNGEWYIDDIQKVNSRNIPKADLYAFGAPCQDFSLAGQRKGLSGERSSLIREVFRIIREQDEYSKPEWLIYENVKGMLSSNSGFDFLAILLEMDELGYDWIWQKSKAQGFLNCNRRPLINYENIMIFYKKQCTYSPQNLVKGEFNNFRPAKLRDEKSKIYGKEAAFGASKFCNYPKTIIKFNSVSKNLHPTQKPTELLEYLIKTYTLENDMVLDNCMGSGSTGVACKNLNRNFIGIELDENYFKLAKERIEKHSVSNKLF